MNYITISTSTVGYSVTFRADSQQYRASARLNRTALLDGTVSIQHYGFSHGDRTKTITGTVTKAQAATLQTIFQSYTGHVLQDSEGVFLGVIEAVDISGSGEASITFLVKEKKTT